jgi:hypothetical protein
MRNEITEVNRRKHALGRAGLQHRSLILTQKYGTNVHKLQISLGLYSGRKGSKKGCLVVMKKTGCSRTYYYQLSCT